MVRKRISTDLLVAIPLINSTGETIDMTDAYDKILMVEHDATKKATSHDFTISEGYLKFQYNSIENNNIGIYNLHFYFKVKNLNSTLGYFQYRYDFNDAFSIVKSSEDEDNLNNSYYKINGTINAYGENGKSAYEIAVINGFVGTSKEWLDSLKLKYSDLTIEEIEQLRQPSIDAAKLADEQTIRLKNIVESIKNGTLTNGLLTIIINE